MANVHWKQKEQFEKWYPRERNTQNSLNNAISQIPKSTQSLSKQRKDSKTSNGPCDLGPKQDQTSFEWRNEQSPKNRNKIMDNYSENVENQSDSWQDNPNTKTPKEGSIHQATRWPRA